MDYIKDVLIESNDKLFYIYWEEIGFNLDRRQKADIVNTLENKYGYNCKADEKGIFIERYDCIKKELANMEETKHICESCEIHHYEGNNIYAKLYYDELTEDSYYVLVYNNFYDFIDDTLGLMECNYIRTRELDNDFYMIVLKNVPNIDCDEE
ncbi:MULTISPECIES: hypothetical protein [unclassified Clostridium]|uniref:hypothetical protein n=1 Tax=Clostridium sp. UMB9555A TaxID=3050593 RepID=UPI002551858D|nr:MULTISPECIES: hypothetical protein [unclassified Clostridium]MDK7589906.1 hypothetical protein [Clostridium sp. UMB9555B]MDK7627700.1 hypothetical protein [Clostridium sp. UMB9555A]